MKFTSYSFHCSLAATEARRLLAGLMSGIKHIHALGVVHRDVKPENILLNNGTPILADFGWAARMTTGKLRGMVGSIAYMAPEVHLDNEYDEKVDLWSAGMFLTHLFL